MNQAIKLEGKRAGRLPPQERQQQLLRCAVRIFAQLGIGAAVHADVAREAEVSVATVFTYFPTRAALNVAVVTEIESFLINLVESVATEAADGEEQLRAILKAFAHTVDYKPDYIKVWMNWSTVVTEPTWSRYLAFQDRILRTFAEQIEDGKQKGHVRMDVDPDIGAYLIMGSGHMIAQMKFRHTDGVIVDTFIDTLIHRSLFTR